MAGRKKISEEAKKLTRKRLNKNANFYIFKKIVGKKYRPHRDGFFQAMTEAYNSYAGKVDEEKK